MPFMEIAQRYANTQTDPSGANSANAREKMWPSGTHNSPWLNRPPPRPHDSGQTAYYSRASTSQYRQYGATEDRYGETAEGYGGFGREYREDDVAYDEYGRGYVQGHAQHRRSGHEEHPRAGYAEHGRRYREDDAANDEYGQGHGQGYAQRGHSGYKDYGRADHADYDRGEYRQLRGYGGGVQGQEDHHWQKPTDSAYSHHSSLYPATAARQGSQQPYFYGGQEHTQQYARPRFEYPSYQQPYGWYQHEQLRLMQQWAAVNTGQLVFSPNAPAFMPQSASQSKPREEAQAPTPAKSVPRAQQQQPLKSVSAAEFNKKYRIDKQSRYGTQNQPQVPAKAAAEAFNPALFNPAFFGQWVPPPPADDSEPGVPDRYKQLFTRKERKAQSAKESKKQQVSLSLPVRTPPLPSRSPTGHLQLIERPVPTKSYIKHASQDPRTLDVPRPLLVVLDLNGTLLFRKQRGGANRFVARPKVLEFLHYLLVNHKVMVWSSATPENVAVMCDRLFTAEQRGKLVGVWARDKLRLSKAHYYQKVQAYKQLSWIWRDHTVASSSVDADNEWSQENTVLIDDSVEKAASEPHNVLKIDEFEGKEEQMKTDVLGQVVRYLETLRAKRNVSAYMRRTPFVYDADAEDHDWMPIVNDMH